MMGRRGSSGGGVQPPGCTRRPPGGHYQDKRGRRPGSTHACPPVSARLHRLHWPPSRAGWRLPAFGPPGACWWNLRWGARPSPGEPVRTRATRISRSGRRQRPSGEAPPLPRPLTTGTYWLAATGVVLLLWLVALANSATNNYILAFDLTLLDWVYGFGPWS